MYALIGHHSNSFESCVSSIVFRIALQQCHCLLVSSSDTWHVSFNSDWNVCFIVLKLVQLSLLVVIKYCKINACYRYLLSPSAAAWSPLPRAVYLFVSVYSFILLQALLRPASIWKYRSTLHFQMILTRKAL